MVAQRPQSFMLISSPQCSAAGHGCGWLKAIGAVGQILSQCNLPLLIFFFSTDDIRSRFVGSCSITVIYVFAGFLIVESDDCCTCLHALFLFYAVPTLPS